MRKSILSVAVLAAVFGSGTAFAGQTTGHITSVDISGKSVILDDGVEYSFNENSVLHDMLGGYLPGDMVHITSFKAGDHIWGTSIRPAS